MATASEVSRPQGGARPAFLVAAGIFSSRITGFIRDRAIAYYFGTSPYADVFRGALRMPNVLQNLLGEGTLSASFIPVYAELLEQGRREEAGRVAGAVFALLVALAGALSLIGILAAPVLVGIFLPGFEGLRRDLTIEATRIIFPMTGVLVLSAWALGILNSHRRFFIPYVAPVLWNGAMITALVLLGGRLTSGRLVIAVSWGAFAGGLLQFGIQLPWVFSLERNLRIRWNTRMAEVREAVRNAGPAILARGAAQLSGWLELFLASLLVAGSVATLSYALTFYLLPIGLFGMSVAAAELPELARQRAQATEVLRLRINAGLRRIAFFVVPSLVAYLVLGDVIVAALYQTGDFGPDDTLWVHAVLAGYAIGLLAATGTRLFSSGFYALHDTRTPARIALVRVLVGGLLGASLMFPLERVTLAGHPLGVVGLSLAAGIATWVEWAALRRQLSRRLGPISAGAPALARMLLSAGLAAAGARAIGLALPEMHPIGTAAIVLAPYGLAYFGLARLFGVEEGGAVLARLFRPVRRGGRRG